jgi:hypothetical protein
MDLEKLLENVAANDGLGVMAVDLGAGSSLSLHFVFRSGGELVPPRAVLPSGDGETSVEFWSRKRADSRAMGEAARMGELAKALCRFLNTGGQMQEVQSLVSELSFLVHTDWHMTIPGFSLLTTHVNEDGEWEHLFAPDKGVDGIRWVENRYIEPVGLVDLVNERTREESSGSEESEHVELLPEAGAEPSKGAAGTTDS